MLAKILAAIAIPVIVVVLVGEILRVTHHTTIPPLRISVTPAAHSSVVHQSATSAQLSACAGKLPNRFSGIAVQGDPATALAAYSKAFATEPQVVEFYNAFKGPFNKFEAEQAVEAGLIPFIQLNPRGVSVQKIANGGFDPYLQTYANAVKTFGCEVILSFGHEMNGWWYSWGRRPAPHSSTTPEEFIAAWQHIHDIFAQQGVTNVKWSWDPSHQHGVHGVGKVATSARKWYPGSGYVDWIGLDGYLGTANGRPQNFRQVFSFQLSAIRKFAPHAKVFLAETAVAPGPSAVSQMAELFSGAATYHLAGVVWFDATGKNNDYRLGKPKHAAENAAYKKDVAAYLANATSK